MQSTTSINECRYNELISDRNSDLNVVELSLLSSLVDTQLKPRVQYSFFGVCLWDLGVSQEHKGISVYLFITEQNAFIC